MTAKKKLWIGGLTVLALLAGCGGPDFYVNVGDAKGMQKGAPVLWRGANVGHVTKVEAASKGVRIEVALDKTVRGQIRADVRAGVEKGALTDGKPALRLYDGTDASKPLLAKGQQVLEATPADTIGLRKVLNSRQAFLGLIALVAVILVMVFSTGCLRFAAGLATVAVLVAFGWLFWRDYLRGGGTVVHPSIVKQLNDFANQTFRSPEAVAAWKRIETDLEELAKKAREGGKVGLQKSQEAATKLLDEQIAQLRAEGKEAAAQDLEQVKRNLNGIITPPAAAQPQAQPQPPPAKPAVPPGP